MNVLGHPRVLRREDRALFRRPLPRPGYAWSRPRPAPPSLRRLPCSLLVSALRVTIDVALRATLVRPGDGHQPCQEYHRFATVRPSAGTAQGNSQPLKRLLKATDRLQGSPVPDFCTPYAAAPLVPASIKPRYINVIASDYRRIGLLHRAAVALRFVDCGFVSVG
jgi:hypothetical protein